MTYNITYNVTVRRRLRRSTDYEHTVTAAMDTSSAEDLESSALPIVEEHIRSQYGVSAESFSIISIEETN